MQRCLFVFPETIKRKIEIVGTKGDYYTASLLLYALNDVPGVTFQLSALRCGNTQIKLELLQAVPGGENPGNLCRSDLLIPPDLKRIRKNCYAAFLLRADIPHDAPGGLYSGSITACFPNARKLSLPITLRVMDFQLPELKGSRGFFSQGHFSNWRATRACNLAARKEWMPENLEKYFLFLKSRRFNSIALYGVYPDVHLVDGKVKLATPRVSTIVKAFRNAGMSGKIIVSTIELHRWANRVAHEIDKRGEIPAGDLGIDINFFPWVSQPLHPRALVYYEAAMKEMLTIAEREKWPALYIAEEEMVNGPWKSKPFDFFNPVLMKLCPERTLIIDNAIGYGFAPHLDIDRGHRDHIRFRSYNSWTEKALEDARKDGAEVWSYNWDATRLAAGFLQQRLGSSAFHQWADQHDETFQGKRYQWSYTRITPDGVLSSRAVEAMHEGHLDLAACKMLETLIGRLKREGRNGEAERAMRDLRSVISDIPVRGNAFRSYAKLITENDLALRRYRLFCAINRAEAVFSQKQTAPAKQMAAPWIKLGKPVRNTKSAFSKRLLLEETISPMTLDAEKKEGCYGTGTGPISYMTNYENMLRAKCSSEREFAERYGPSYSGAFLAYSPEGIYFYIEQNHVMPTGKFRFSRQNSDPELYKDDVVELFFLVPSSRNNIQLIMNPKGKKTLLRNGQVISPDPVCLASRSPINKSGGTAHEGLIPWHVFGLERIPAPGTLWKFNFAREYNTMNQFTSWAPVESSFLEHQRWGEILFAGHGKLNSLQKLDLPDIYPDRNIISGQWKKGIPGGTCLILRDAERKIIASCRGENARNFKLDFKVKPDEIKTQWSLSIEKNGKVLESISFLVRDPAPGVVPGLFPGIMLCGETVTGKGDFRFANGMKSPMLTGELIDGKGVRHVLGKTPLQAPGEWEILFNPGTAAPGSCQLFLRLDHCGGDQETLPTAREFELLPNWK